MWSWSLNQGKPPRLDGCGIPAETGNCSSTRKAAAQFQCLNVASAAGAALLYYAVLLRLLSLSRFAPSLRPYFVEAGIFGIRWLQLVGMLHCVQAIKISSHFAFIYIVPCQVRVVRFYQSCCPPPRPPPPPPPAPPPPPPPPPVSPVCTAGHQPGTFPAQCAPLDLNLGPSQLSVHRWTSTWDLPSSVCTAGPQRPDRMPEDMPDRMSDRMPEDMSDRMPEDLPVTKCIMSWWGSHEVKYFFSNQARSVRRKTMGLGVPAFSNTQLNNAPDSRWLFMTISTGSIKMIFYDCNPIFAQPTSRITGGISQRSEFYCDNCQVRQELCAPSCKEYGIDFSTTVGASMAPW